MKHQEPRPCRHVQAAPRMMGTDKVSWASLRFDALLAAVQISIYNSAIREPRGEVRLG
jgi:hypothetical protein